MAVEQVRPIRDEIARRVTGLLAELGIQASYGHPERTPRRTKPGT
jgi:hypothetical protein